MTEIRTDMIPVRVSKQCDSCGVGFMEYQREGSTWSEPPALLHVCSASCGLKQVYSQIYPRIDYKPAPTSGDLAKAIAESLESYNLTIIT